MKATELRIGNWVNDFANEPHQVIHLTKDKIILETPIPLTEDWLIKFGLKKCRVRNLYPNSFLMENVLKSGLYFRPSYQGGYYWGFITPEDIEHEFYDVRPVQYVHDLQNLYFALTGNELQ